MKLSPISHRPPGSMIPRIEHELIVDTIKNDAMFAIIVADVFGFCVGLAVGLMIRVGILS